MRQCGDCSMCCQGWLKAEVFGEEISPGNPCMFVDKLGVKGCSIYHMERPPVCTRYLCAWRQDENIPDWMQPNKIRVIIDYRRDVYRVARCDSIPGQYKKAVEWMEQNKHLHGREMQVNKK